MPENWKTYRLEDLTTRVTVGFVGSMAQEYVEDGIPMLRSQNIKPFCLDYGNLKYISPKFHAKIRKSSLKKDDVAIVRTGNPGTACVIPEGIPELNCSDLVIATPDKSKIDPHFLSFYFNSIASNYINSELVGAVQQHFNVGSAKKMEIKIPKIQEQHKIVSILKAIQDKIELNLQMNKTLEEMAMALYKYWFVDFGPLQDGEFVDSELGEIPKGWEVKKLRDLIETLSKGTTPTKKDVDGLLGEIPFLKVKDVLEDGSLKFSSIEKIPRKVHEKSLKRSILKYNDILMSIAGTIGRVSLVPEQLDNSNCNQALAFIRLKEKQQFLYQIYFWLKSASVQNEINSSIVQGVQANVSLTVLKNLDLIVADLESQQNFNVHIKPIFKTIFNNKDENQTLTQLRDTLLPKLISGEVRVKDAEKTLSEVL